LRAIRILLIIFLLCHASIACASEEPPAPDKTAAIFQLLDSAIAANLIAGGVVVIGNHDGILATVARGRMDARPDAPLLDENTIFDLASLTKVIATTPAVMKLLDKGRISLNDPISRWFPQFKRSKGDITILNLLTHTSGLTDFDVKAGQSMKSAIRKAAAERRRPRPGSRFEYADINFIILGELVHRVSGTSLDVFCHDKLYAPLGAQNTMFLPPRELDASIAPTLGYSSGTVQDRNSRRLGSVAGHAGLFSSANDLSRYARMLLGSGAIDGRRILSEKSVTQMTTPYFCSANGTIRSPGWDMKSHYSSPKGDNFSEYSFGHTGYSGSSIWIDPKLDLFVIVLTNRLNYTDTGKFNQLRRDLSTVAVAEFKTPDNTPPMELAQTTSDLLKAMALPLPRPFRTSKIAARHQRTRLVAYRQERVKHGKKHRNKTHSRRDRA
jgi:CubicO group peptidase (beta-lactamase class C family)